MNNFTAITMDGYKMKTFLRPKGLSSKLKRILYTKTITLKGKKVQENL